MQNREPGIEAAFTQGRPAASMNGPLLRDAGEGWGGGDWKRVSALAPIRPSGTFPRTRGKELLPKGGVS